MSCIGDGYLTGNMLLPFPFKDGQFLAWSDEGRALELQRALQRCFVDASVSLKASSLPESEWPRIGDFSIAGDALSFKVAAYGSYVPMTVSGVSAARFPIVSGIGPWGTYVIVMSSEGISDFCNLSPPACGFARSSSGGSEGLYLDLCTKCVTLLPEGLSSIQVYDGVHSFESGPHAEVSGDALIKPGNNMRIGEDDDDPNGIELNAEPGAGLGVIKCDGSDEAKDGEKLIGGSDGHARIFNDTCYDLEPSTTTGVVQMHAKCTACCTCDMYESIVNDRLVALADAVRAAKSKIDEMHQAYESAVKKFNDRISRPYIEDVTMTLSGMPIGSKISPDIDNEDVKGRMERCVFTAIISNSSYFDITVEVVMLDGTDTIVEASAAWSDQEGNPLSVTGDGVGAVMENPYIVYPGRSLVVTFVSVKNTMVNKVVTGGYVGRAQVDVSWENEFLGSLRETVSV